mgnify:CR=1 FL=1
MIKYKNIVGKKPKFIILDKLESTDINDAVDFKSAQFITLQFPFFDLNSINVQILNKYESN